MVSHSRVIDKFWKIFISLRLTFVLLLVIILGAFLGMGFDQTLTFDDYFFSQDFSAWLQFFIITFELNDAYHSWWFSFAILLLSMNLIVCSFERLPKIYFEAKRPRPLLTKRRLLGLQNQYQMTVKSEEKAKKIVERFFLGKKTFLTKVEGSSFFFIDKYRAARFGVYVVHVALLIVMFSSIIATQTGVDGNVFVEEGAKVRFIKAKGTGGITYTHDLGFYLGCDEFKLDTFVDNTPMNYTSKVFIETIDGQKILEKNIAVNDPVSFQGYTFYQASYQPLGTDKQVKILITGPNEYQKLHQVPLNESIFLPNKKVITPTNIYEDYSGLGQAVKIDLVDENEETFFHVFRRYPHLDELIRSDDYSVVFLGTDQKYATGISVGKLPGISFIFLGFSILLVGLFMCFFMNPRRYFCRVKETEKGYEVVFASQGFRNPSFIKQDFNKKIVELQRLT